MVRLQILQSSLHVLIIEHDPRINRHGLEDENMRTLAVSMVIELSTPGKI